MTYQCLAGAAPSATCCSISGPLGDELEGAGEGGVDAEDEDADDGADDEDEHGQLAGLLGGRPGHLLQLGPRFVHEAADTLHSGSLFLVLSGLRGGRRGRTRTDN